MKSIVLINLVWLLLVSGCVSQSELTSLDTRLNELELRNAEAKQNSQMLKSGLENREGEEQELRHQAATLRAKMDALNEELRILSGRVEKIEYALNRQKQLDAETVNAKGDQIDQMAKTAKSNDERIYRIEQYLNFEPSKQLPSIETPAETSTAKIVPVTLSSISTRL